MTALAVKVTHKTITATWISYLTATNSVACLLLTVGVKGLCPALNQYDTLIAFLSIRTLVIFWLIVNVGLVFGITALVRAKLVPRHSAPRALTNIPRYLITTFARELSKPSHARPILRGIIYATKIVIRCLEIGFMVTDFLITAIKEFVKILIEFVTDTLIITLRIVISMLLIFAAMYVALAGSEVWNSYLHNAFWSPEQKSLLVQLFMLYAAIWVIVLILRITIDVRQPVLPHLSGNDRTIPVKLFLDGFKLAGEITATISWVFLVAGAILCVGKTATEAVPWPGFNLIYNLFPGPMMVVGTVACALFFWRIEYEIGRDIIGSVRNRNKRC